MSGNGPRSRQPHFGGRQNGVHVETNHFGKQCGHGCKRGTGSFGSLGARGPVPLHAAVLARHQHRQCRLADHGTGVRRLLPGGPVGRPRLSSRHHHPDRQRRAARRHRRPPPAAAGRALPVHAGLGPVRRRADALAADCRPGGAGARRGRHDGPHHGVRRGDGAEGKDRQCHGAARNDVGDRHRARSLARRRSDRRAGVAGDLPRQPAARTPGARARPSHPAH